MLNPQAKLLLILSNSIIVTIWNGNLLLMNKTEHSHTISSLHYDVNEIEILRFPRQYFHTLHFSMCNLHMTSQLLGAILYMKKSLIRNKEFQYFPPLPLQYFPNPACFFTLAYSVSVYNVTPKLLPSPTSVLAPFFHHSTFWILNCLHACQSISSFAWVSLVDWRKDRDRNTPCCFWLRYYDDPWLSEGEL